MTPSPALTRRHEFVLLFDIVNGNPNGDPDAGNMPRLDPETSHGLVSDVALKRKVRNFVALARGEEAGHEIYMRDGAILNVEHKRAFTALEPEIKKDEDFKRGPKDPVRAASLTRWMCDHFYDIRTFGAVMSTGVNAGQVRGPVQFSFARSVEPILPLEIAITRRAATTVADNDSKGGRTIGRKFIVPYGLYRAHGYVSASLASHPIKGTGFSEADLELLFDALVTMFDHDRSAARGEMTTRKLVIFRHATALGNARAQTLFDRVTVARVGVEGRGAVGAPVANTLSPARAFSDYSVNVDHVGLPGGIEIFER